MSQRSFRPICVTLAIICLLPAAPDEQHVTDLDIATLSCGSNIHPLVLATSIELFPRDRVVVKWVVVNAFLMSIAPVVKQNATAGDSMVCPVMN